MSRPMSENEGRMARGAPGVWMQLVVRVPVPNKLLRQNCMTLLVDVERLTTPVLHIYILLHCATNR
jgi:hypothetical protein